MIESINGEKINSKEEVMHIVEESEGKDYSFECHKIKLSDIVLLCNIMK